MNPMATMSASALLAAAAVAVTPGAARSAAARERAAHIRSSSVSATQSPEHALLAGLAGQYTLTARFWPDPRSEPVESQLPARRSLILEGRVLQIEVGPDARGFRGTGLMGYDEGEERFWYVWTDTSTTGVSFLEGSLDPSGAGRLEGSRPTPGGRAPLRIQIRRRGLSEVHEYRTPAEPDGEVRYLELRYDPLE